jgi:26S proteasome non-ATPase regulatory subunit 5
MNKINNNEMSVDTSANEKVLSRLQQLCQGLATSQSLDPQMVKELNEYSSPANTMSVLVPFLFRDVQENNISNSEALSLMGALVASEPASFLKPTSQAVLDEVTRLSQSTTDSLCISSDLLLVIVSPLRGEDVHVADNATTVLVCISRRHGSAFIEQVMPVLQHVWKESWQQLISSSGPSAVSASTTCVRCVNALVELALMEDTFMRVALSTGALNSITTMLTYDSDPLLQISALDLFERLASTQPFHPSRTQWLLTSQEDFPLRTILAMAGVSADSSPGIPDPLLGGSALRVVARLCKLLHWDTASAAAEQDSHFLLTSFHKALHHWDEQTSGSEVDRFTMIDAISAFASASDEALDLIICDPVTRYAWLSFQSVAQSKLKAAILISVAHVLDPSMIVVKNTDSWTPRAPSDAMTMKLFACIGDANSSSFRGDTMELLLSLVRSPIPEVRLAVYELLRAVAKMPAAGQVLWNHGEFFPMMLSRDIETTKEGREAKYAIIQGILSSPLKGLLSEELVKQLEKYSEQGPHYKKVQSWDVATE